MPMAYIQLTLHHITSQVHNTCVLTKTSESPHNHYTYVCTYLGMSIDFVTFMNTCIYLAKSHLIVYIYSEAIALAD